MLILYISSRSVNPSSITWFLEKTNPLTCLLRKWNLLLPGRVPRYGFRRTASSSTSSNGCSNVELSIHESLAAVIIEDQRNLCACKQRGAACIPNYSVTVANASSSECYLPLLPWLYSLVGPSYFHASSFFPSSFRSRFQLSYCTANSSLANNSTRMAVVAFQVRNTRYMRNLARYVPWRAGEAW